MSEQDPREAMAQDAAEMASRDQQTWEANIAMAQMNVLSQAQHASVMEHRAACWKSLSNVLNVGGFVGALFGLTAYAHYVVGLFR